MKKIIKKRKSLALIFFWGAFIISDLVHNNILVIPWFNSLLNSILQKIILYDPEGKILGSNFGIIMTLVSVFVPLNMSNMKRQEQQIYGIPREEFELNETKFLYMVIETIIYFSPLLSFIFLILNFFFSFYGLLLFSYLFFLWYYYNYERGYSRKFCINLVSEKLCSCFENNNSKEDIRRYQLCLNRVGKYIEEKGSWQDAFDIFTNMSTRASYKGNILFSLFFYYYKIIFFQRSKNCDDIAIIFLQDYINFIQKKNSQKKGDEETQNRNIRFILIMVALQNLEEKNLVSFLEWFSDFGMRNRQMIEGNFDEISYSEQKKQMTEICVLLEMRFRIREEIREKNTILCVKKSWEKIYGGKGFEEIKSSEYFLPNHLRNIFHMAIMDLTKDYTEGTDRSRLVNYISLAM